MPSHNDWSVQVDNSNWSEASGASAMSDSSVALCVIVSTSDQRGIYKFRLIGEQHFLSYQIFS